MICNFDKKSGWRRFAFGALSGLVGGNLYFLKVRSHVCIMLEHTH